MVENFEKLAYLAFSSISGGTRCQSTFTLGWPILSGFAPSLAPRPFTFDLGV